MPMEQIVAFVLFAVVAAVTPGPSNIMLTAAGANVGVLRGLPCLFGVAAGMGLMMFVVPLGLGSLVLGYPVVLTALHWGGAVVLLWLSWKIATSRGAVDAASAGDQVGFLGAAIFQWVNPKALTLVLGVVTAFTTVGGSPWVELATICLVFAVAVNLSSAIWCLFGMAIRSFLRSPRALRITALIMAAVLAASVVMLFV